MAQTFGFLLYVLGLGLGLESQVLGLGFGLVAYVFGLGLGLAICVLDSITGSIGSSTHTTPLQFPGYVLAHLSLAQLHAQKSFNHL